MQEEAPTNSVAGGGVAGITGEPGVPSPAINKYKKENAKNAPKLARRKSFKEFISK